MTPRTFRIDVHHHILTPEYMSILEGMGVKEVGGVTLPAWDPSGTLERRPDIRFILSHAGGTVPYLVWRLTLGQYLPSFQDKVLRGVETYRRDLYYDTALWASPLALRSLQECMDNSHILFGSDYPLAPEPVTDASINGLEAYEGFGDKALAAVYGENAAALFPRLKRE